MADLALAKLPVSNMPTAFGGDAGSRGPKRLTEVVKVIDLARANNVSIMLTQFAAYKGGALEVRHAVLTGSKLGLERLSLLLQVCSAVL